MPAVEGPKSQPTPVWIQVLCFLFIASALTFILFPVFSTARVGGGPLSRSDPKRYAQGAIKKTIKALQDPAKIEEFEHIREETEREDSTKNRYSYAYDLELADQVLPAHAENIFNQAKRFEEAGGDHQALAKYRVLYNSFSSLSDHPKVLIRYAALAYKLSKENPYAKKRGEAKEICEKICEEIIETRLPFWRRRFNFGSIPNDPDQLMGFAYAAASCSMEGDEAIESLKKAIPLIPKSPIPHYYLADRLLASRKYSEALKAFHEAERLNR